MFYGEVMYSEKFLKFIEMWQKEFAIERSIDEKVCIDKDNNNPYRMWERAGKPEMTDELLRKLRAEGKLKPTSVQKGSEPLSLKLTPNCTYLITVIK